MGTAAIETGGEAGVRRGGVCEVRFRSIYDPQATEGWEEKLAAMRWARVEGLTL